MVLVLGGPNGCVRRGGGAVFDAGLSCRTILPDNRGGLGLLRRSAGERRRNRGQHQKCRANVKPGWTMPGHNVCDSVKLAATANSIVIGRIFANSSDTLGAVGIRRGPRFRLKCTAQGRDCEAFFGNLRNQGITLTYVDFLGSITSSAVAGRWWRYQPARRPEEAGLPAATPARSCRAPAGR